MDNKENSFIITNGNTASKNKKQPPHSQSQQRETKKKKMEPVERPPRDPKMDGSTRTMHEHQQQYPPPHQHQYQHQQERDFQPNSHSPASSCLPDPNNYHHQHYQQQQPSAGPASRRSASQPRQSQSPATTTAREGGGTTTIIRSASQPRALQEQQLQPNSHFLEGFNVADCSDFRSIPDPPTPQLHPYSSSSARSSSRSRKRSQHHRRVSSVVLRPMSSMDVNNRGNNNHNEGEEDGTGASSNNKNKASARSSSSSITRRRKRKTLSHVPFPLYPAGTTTEGKPDPREETVCDNNNRGPMQHNTNKKMSLELSIYDDDDDDVHGRAYSPKRKKNRTSMVVPRHIPLEDTVEAEEASSATAINTIPMNHHYQPQHQEQLLMESSPTTKTKKFVPLDFNAMQNLRNLVRGYCSLSSEEQERGESKEANEILSITGYALPRKVVSPGTPIVEEQNNSNSNSNKTESIALSNRRRVIKKLSPLLVQLEQRKHRDAQRWEDLTQCRVSQSKRTGRYRYHDIATAIKVGSQEYKRRYIAILQQEQPIRTARTQHWMDDLFRHVNDNSTDYTPQEVYQHPNQYDDAATADIRSQYERQQREAFTPPQSPMKNHVGTREGVVDASGTDHFPQQINAAPSFNSTSSSNSSMLDENPYEEIAEITEASSEDTEDNNPHEAELESRSRSPSPTTTTMVETFDNETTKKNMTMTTVAEGVSQSSSLLPISLPLPIQDSTDPDIAAAEKRLWAKIDRALKEYSADVMMIENSRASCPPSTN